MVVELQTYGKLGSSSSSSATSASAYSFHYPGQYSTSYPGANIIKLFTAVSYDFSQ
jgi:hypothetical protein